MNDKAVEILRELIADIEAAGVRETARDWPDLVVTYRKAKMLLDPARRDR